MKIRTGYVSNSSSSSFIINNNKDIAEAIELFNEFVKKINVKKWFEGCKRVPTKSDIRKVFANAFTDKKSNDLRESFSNYLSGLIYYFEDFYESYLLIRKWDCFDCVHRNGLPCKEKDCSSYYPINYAEERRKYFLEQLQYCPKPFPKDLILSAKKRVEMKLASGVYDYLTTKDLEKMLDVWMNLYTKATGVSFSSDNGIEEENFIRSHLGEFNDFCRSNGLDSFLSDNS